MTVPIAFVDCETTDIGHRRLAWELAIIRREPDGSRREMQTFIEIDLTDANPFALQVGRFHERHPLGRWMAGGADMHPGNALSNYRTMPKRLGFSLGVEDSTQGYVTQEEAAALWCRWTHGAHIVGAVPNFDTEVMGTAARAAGLLPGHHYHLIDVENLIVGYLRAVSLEESGATREHLEALCAPPWKSDDLLDAVGVVVPEDERHTALGDARAAERAYDRVMGGAA